MPSKPSSAPMWIAVGLLGFYSACVAFIAYMTWQLTKTMGAADPTPPTLATWLDLLKTGFVLLGGGVTTIVGHYFGGQQGSAALDAANTATKSANAALEAAKATTTRANLLAESLHKANEALAAKGLDLVPPPPP
jgi:hypothetical protein